MHDERTRHALVIPTSHARRYTVRVASRRVATSRAADEASLAEKRAMQKAAETEAEVAYLEAKKVAVADEVSRLQRQLEGVQTALASSATE